MPLLAEPEGDLLESVCGARKSHRANESISKGVVEDTKEGRRERGEKEATRRRGKRDVEARRKRTGTEEAALLSVVALDDDPRLCDESRVRWRRRCSRLL